MDRATYLRMIDSGADSQDIAQAALNEGRAGGRPDFTGWHANQHLVADQTVQHSVLTINDPPHQQRVFGTPVYDRNGDMHCRCCGGPMNRANSVSGESIASCGNIGCKAQGFAYAEGSYIHNPARVPK